jgi:hypothetical protein
VTNNGDEIKAKVEEVQNTEIKYRKYDNLPGLSYTMNKSDIFMVKYENGSKDVFGTGNKNNSSEAVPGSGQVAPAIIYFYRPSKMVGSLPGITIGTIVPDEVIVLLHNGRWHRSEYTSLGHRELVNGIYSINDKKLAIDFESGKTYYLRCSIMPGMGLQSQVELVDEDIGKKEMSGLKEQEQAIVK